MEINRTHYPTDLTDAQWNVIAGLMVEKNNGRKRHIAVDIMGNVLTIVVHPANLHDTMTGLFPALGAYTLYPTIKAFCVDAGYSGSFEDEVMDMMNLPMDITARNEQKKWEYCLKDR